MCRKNVQSPYFKLIRIDCLELIFYLTHWKFLPLLKESNYYSPILEKSNGGRKPGRPKRLHKITQAKRRSPFSAPDKYSGKFRSVNVYNYQTFAIGLNDSKRM